VNSERRLISEALLALPAHDTLVLSPSDRARRAYERAWAGAQLSSRSTKVVTLPRFATVQSWLTELWEEAQLFGLIDDATQLISPVIERALWRHVVETIAQSTDAESAALADRLLEAWMLEHCYGGSGATPFATGTSGELYRAARQRFVALLKSRRAMTYAELPLRIEQRAKAFKPLVPRYLVQTPSFAPLPSQQRAIDALVAAGDAQAIALSSATTVADRVERAMFSDPTDERDAAIEWAQRSVSGQGIAMRMPDVTQGIAPRMPDVTQGIAPRMPFTIVVPDLKQSRGSWQRRLEASGIDYNLSLGLPVSAHPWAAAGFTLVSALEQSLPVETISQALRHSRWGHRAQNSVNADRPMQSALSAGIHHLRLMGYLTLIAPLNGVMMSKVDALVRELTELPARRTRIQWRGFFEHAIAAFTSSETAMSSEVFQLRQSLLESIETWQALDDWLPAVTMLDAQQELMAITDQAAFQPEGSDAPLQVIGLLESAGVPFAGVWITSMTEHVLPEAHRSNPFLLASWQREAGAGLASIEECDDRATRLVSGWTALSSQVIASMAERVDGEPQVWSPRASAWPLREKIQRAFAQSDTLTSNPNLIARDDERAPSWRAPPRLNVRTIESQALCPRQGFASGRLKLDGWPNQFDGLSPMVRGNLVHAIAEALGRLQMTQTLDEAALYEALPQFISEAVDAAQLKHSHIAAHVWSAERARLDRVWRAWVGKEIARPPFTVKHVEEQVQTQIAGLHFSLRMDRVDQIEAVYAATGEIRDDRFVVIDFKSGGANVAGLSDERLTAPQLPLYAHALGTSSVDAAVYARVNDDDQDFKGVGTVQSGFAPRKNAMSDTSATWEAIRDSWSGKLETLANELLAGDAALAPAYGETTCNRCEFSRFCRVDFQRLAQADDDAAERAEDNI
jgi:ATP-dependent helicase/nuclease subunit B